MNFFWQKCLILLLLAASCVSPKKTEKSDTTTLDNLKQHIQYLADDKLEGRRTGTNGEKLAMEYISSQFRSIGLLPKGTESYYQPFDVDDGKQIGAGTSLSINGKLLQPGIDFFPFPYSPNQSIEALTSIALHESLMPWIVDLGETLEEGKDNSKFDLPEFIKTYSKNANDKGASLVIFFNSSKIDDHLSFEAKDRSAQMPIPVLYVSKQAASKYLSDKSATLTIRMKTDISEKKRIGHNVIGYIDNGAGSTIILGAHFDHLGYGEDGNSLLRTGEKLIHNGADDNASGTAALIELARKLKNSLAKNMNYLFIAFSGEELGLFGSKYFTEHPTINLSQADCMINMDMVGRLNDSTRALTVGGYGTSPSWSGLFSNISAGKNNSSIVFKFDSSGTGPSDHTSFYRKDIPVLFYFTGSHADYHKPTDDADKINYAGESMIVQHIFSLVELLGKNNKLVFTKTRETQTSSSARAGVTMGIMPDYTFTGNGVRADGISEGRPAQRAGLKTGDIIIGLGDNKITSLESYMQALGKFKKGEKTIVKYKRGVETMETTVEF